MINDSDPVARRHAAKTVASVEGATLVPSRPATRGRAPLHAVRRRRPARRARTGGPRLALGGYVGEALALGLLAAVVLISFRDSIGAGLVAFQKDTQVFYYPLELWFAEEFKAGRFPLWNPYIFAGYPIFADGEIGLAYPLHLALLYLLPVAQTFIWLRISSVLVAAAAMYALCRALGVGRLAAILGALTFSLGSFFLSQQHHENVTRTAAWLPLVLACVEWALHRAGWRRHLFLIAAAGALAMSALGLHPQVLAMSLLAFASFVIFRVAAGPVGGRSEVHGSQPSALSTFITRCALVIWVGGYVGGLGLGLASVQLLPLAEMGAATYRGSLPDYFFATSYALPPQNLVTLLFPYFFRGPDSEYWSLWAKWETALYVGVAPLVLGALGVLLARRREVVYFLVLAAVALWLAFATYAPFDLYGVLWSIPGFSSFRVPGRYAYLFVLAWSVLAAFGLHALAQRREKRTGERLPGTGALFPIVLLGVGALAGVWCMGNLRASLRADPIGSLDWIRAGYLSLRHHAEGIEPMAVYEGLVHSLDLANTRTSFALILLALSLALTTGLALVTQRSARLWQGAFVGVAALDLLLFGMGFHRKLPIDQLSQSTPAIQFLQGCGIRYSDCRSNGAGHSALDEWRVFTSGTIPSLESDRLVPFRLQDIGGYSSLESRRNYAYWTTISSVQNQLLDMANVRYLVYPTRGPTLPSYRLVPFDPERPLMMGGQDTVGGFEAFALAGEAGHRLQVVAALTRALDVPHGATVAEITVVPRDGPPEVLDLRAGLDVAEWAYDRPDVVGTAKHEKPAEIAFRRPDVFLVDGKKYDLYLYYTERDLPHFMEVERIEVRYVHPLGGMELYGVGLYNFDTGQTAPVTAQMRAKLRLRYQDDEVRILENQAAFPRAYVIPRARIAPQNVSALSAMLDTPFDPTRDVMLERLSTQGWQVEIRDRRLEVPRRPAIRDLSESTVSDEWVEGLPYRFPTASLQSPNRVPEPLEIGTDHVAYRAWAPDGGYFVHVANFLPGWRARVDGQEAPILPANGLFRGVPLTPGEHTVELRYEPAAIALGLQTTAWAALVAAATLAAAFLAVWLERRRLEARQAP